MTQTDSEWDAQLEIEWFLYLSRESVHRNLIVQQPKSSGWRGFFRMGSFGLVVDPDTGKGLAVYRVAYARLAATCGCPVVSIGLSLRRSWTSKAPGGAEKGA